MRYRFPIWLCLILLIRATAIFAQPTMPAGTAQPAISPEPALPAITRGQQVTVHGRNLPPPGEEGEYQVFVDSGRPGGRIALPAKWVDANSFTFSLPQERNRLPEGRYLVSVRIAGKEYQVPGDLRVLPESQAPVHLDSIYPVTAYPTKHAGSDFEIAGQNLAAAPRDNILIVVGRGPVPVGTASECEDARRIGKYSKTCLYVEPGMETRKLKVVNFPRGRYDGPVQIQVQVGNSVSNALPLTFSRVSERAARIGAVVAFALIMAIVVRLVWKGVGTQIINGRRYGPWTSFFLEKETNTYSLSKFQLLLWTSIFVFGYVYLFLCRMLIQWNFDLPPVPDGLPGMLAISAGATVVSAGVTETRGSKGAGHVYPSAADFVSSGGMVVGERFQFFVWNIVGAFEFVAMILMRDPATFTELPAIPENFLYLMGISSAGYIAGKFIRKPGPVIRGLTIASITPPSPPNQAVMTIKLQGENLSDCASITVDNIHLHPESDFTLVGIKRHDQAADSTFCREVEVVLKNATGYLEGDHVLTLTNRDGQAAAVHIPDHPVTIGAVSSVEHGTAPVSVQVEGSNFTEGIKAVWKDATGKETALEAGEVTRSSDAELAVTIVPGEKMGTGRLTLITAEGLRGNREVIVR